MVQVWEGLENELYGHASNIRFTIQKRVRVTTGVI